MFISSNRKDITVLAPILDNNSGEELMSVDVRKVHPDPTQHRKHFDEAYIRGLAESIDKDGQLIKVFIRPHSEKPGEYILIAGEQRWRAISSYCVSTKTIGAILVRNSPDGKRGFRRAMLIENANKKALYPLELAEAFKEFVDGGMSQADVARMAGVEQATVSFYLSLHRLHPEVKKHLDPSLPERKRMGTSAAVAISRLPQDLQCEIAQHAMEKSARFREVDHLITQTLTERGVHREKKTSGGHRALRAHLSALESVVRVRFPSVDSVLDAFFRHGGGKIPIAELDSTIALSREVRRLLELLESRLLLAREKKEKKQGGWKL